MDVKEILPQEIMLSTYPNPFNPTTTLSFTVQNEGLLQLSIYNISGQLVSELAHEYRTPGSVEYNWDAGNHPSGVYLARLNINNTFYTQKLVLMK
jgi:flagellar hook assembly protein FlgD